MTRIIFVLGFYVLAACGGSGDSRLEPVSRNAGINVLLITLVGLVERLAYSGALTTTKAGMLLDVKPLKVHRLFQTGQPA